MQKVNVYWHRRDLRFIDNAGLYRALCDDLPVLPVFIFDTNILEKLQNKRDARVQFIHDQVKKLDAIYRKNHSGLAVFYGTPEETFQKIIAKYEVNAVYTNGDYEPSAKQRDQSIRVFLTKRSIDFYTFKDHVIFEESEISTDHGEPYRMYTPYKKKWLDRFTFAHSEPFESELNLKNLYTTTLPEVMSLNSIGFEPSDIKIPDPVIVDKVLDEYSEKRDFPDKDATSRIGVHLRFGTISIRQAVKRGIERSDTWLSELIWREFYIMILTHFPHVVDNAFKPQYDHILWVNNEEHFTKWCEGKTGYPIVDAGMRELNATGYMHNRVRMIVASFLTKHLLIDWRWGEQYFAEKLLDFELASNNGGWQWAAGTGTDAQPYFRVFNPHSQQEKFDKDFKYIRKWIPEFGTGEYPKPIVDHKEARLRAIETYKEVLL